MGCRCPLLWVIIHYSINELKFLVVFYLGFRTTLKSVAYTELTQRTPLYLAKFGDQQWQMTPSHHDDVFALNRTLTGDLAEAVCREPTCQAKESTLKGYLDCVHKGISGALTSLNWGYSAECVSFPRGRNLYGFENLMALCMCAGWFMMMVVALLRLAWREIEVSGGNLTVRSGRYLRFTWGLEKRTAYKVMSYLVVTFAVCATMDVLWYSWQQSYEEGWDAAVQIIATNKGVEETMDKDSKSMHNKKAILTFLAVFLSLIFYFIPFLMASIVPLFATVFGAVRMLKPHVPTFNFHSEEFANIQFKSTMKQVFTEANDTFANKLEGALLDAKYGNYRRLEALLVDSSQA